MSLEGPPDLHGVHSHSGDGHKRGGPPLWLEWATSISALVVSVSSIAIAVHHGDTMDRLVKANSYPYLIGVFSDATPEGGRRISIDLINNGVGPAHEQSLRVQVGKSYVTSVPDLIAASIGPVDAADATAALTGYYRNSVRTRFIAAHDSQFVFRLPRTDANARYWDALAKASSSWRMQYCYCSVFQECWAVQGEDHTPVAQCKRDEPHEFLP
jgi:hypothetical protein